jgi:cobalt/nickel transport system ATP-binding protein
MEKPLFEMKNVSFSYLNGFKALEDISLKVKAREKIVILGANGTGKSTLLSILDGLLFPQTGEITFLGHSMTEDSLQEESFHYFFRKSVGFVFQNPDAQLFSSNVRDEIAFGPLQLGKGKKEVEQIVQDVLKMLRIEHLQDRSPYQLSYGEKKRVALGSVIAINPDVLLLDEPSSGLDPRSSRDLIDFLVEAHNAGKTLVTATNDLHIVPEIADSIYILSEDKRIIFHGPAEEALSNEDLLQSSNLIHIHKHLHDSRWHLHPHLHYDAKKDPEKS